MMTIIFVRNSKVLLGIVAIVKCCEGFKKHLGDTNPNGDFLVLHPIGIVLLVSGIISYCLRNSHL